MIMRRSRHDGASYREIQPSDVEKLELLQTDLFPVQYTKSFYQKLFQEDHYSILAFSHDNELIGVASARVNRKESECAFCWSSEPSVEGYVMTLGVKNSFREQGIGSILLEKICTQLEQAGCTYIFLHVKVDNVKATAFYVKHGFLSELELREYYFINGRNYSAFKMGRKIGVVKYGPLRRLYLSMRKKLRLGTCTPSFQTVAVV